MRESIIEKLTAKDDKYACAIADKIISEGQDTDEWYDNNHHLIVCEVDGRIAASCVCADKIAFIQWIDI